MKEDGLARPGEEATADMRRSKAAGSASRCAAESELTKSWESSGCREERWRQWWSGEVELGLGRCVGTAGTMRKTDDGHARVRGLRGGPGGWRRVAAARLLVLLLLRLLLRFLLLLLLLLLLPVLLLLLL